MISGYTASVSTPRPWVMYAERSLSAARLISFPFKSETGSIKSNETQHCLNFRMNNSSCSILEISTKESQKKAIITARWNDNND